MGCPPESYRAPQDGCTPLLLAAKGGHLVVAQQLVAAEADKEARDKVRGEGGRGLRIGKELRGNTQLLVPSCFLIAFLLFSEGPLGRLRGFRDPWILGDNGTKFAPEML